MALEHAVFTSNGTWNWPEGVTSVYAEALSGGSGGGGALNGPAAGGGGAGGCYMAGTITKTHSSLNIVVGAGGAGNFGSGSSGGASGITQNAIIVLETRVMVGGGGGDSSFGGGATLPEIGTGIGEVSFLGGHGSNASSTGGTGSGYSGAGGGAAWPASNGINASGFTPGSQAPEDGVFQDGVRYSAGGQAGKTTPGSATLVPSNYGGGGVGGFAATGSSDKGGDGSQGIVVLTWETPPPITLPTQGTPDSKRVNGRFGFGAGF